MFTFFSCIWATNWINDNVFLNFELYMMVNIQKHSNSECYTPVPESFMLDLLIL
jgi:hypothetical protein